MTPDDLRRDAVRLDAAGQAALDRGDARAAAVAFNQAQVRRLAAEELERLGAKALPTVRNQSTVTRQMMTSEHRVAISKGRSDPKDELSRLARAKKMSLRGLAREAGIGWTLFQLARKGERDMPTRVAERIRDLTGYPVSRWLRLS